MKTISKKEKPGIKLSGSDDIEVKAFIEEIVSERKKDVVDEKFKEDDVLEILNHKRRWKKTLSKRAQRLLRAKKINDNNLKLN
jgi:hypothetical protein